jgi:hypothetical protein
MQIITTTGDSFLVGTAEYPAGVYDISILTSKNPDYIRISDKDNIYLEAPFDQVQLNGIIYLTAT